MALKNHKKLELERLKKLVADGNPYEALKELSVIAGRNHLHTEASQIAKIRENFQFLDSHQKANSIEPSFADTKRNDLVFEIYDLLDAWSDREDIEVPMQEKKEVNLLLDATVGLNEEKKLAIVKTLGKILGVSSDNIGIEQAVIR